MNFLLLISLFYVVVGVRIVSQIWRERRSIFDTIYTQHDRHLVNQAAFFVMIPISVALHEVGHAVAIKAFGGDIDGFGFYLFAGWVGYSEPFSPTQELVVTLAGTLVNLLLFVLVMGAVFLKRPSFRAPVNDLLISFSVLQVVNALVFYPLLDYGTNMNGDWMQIYGTTATQWRMPILIAHIGLLLAGYLVSKNPAFRRKLATLTGLPPGSERGLLGGMGGRRRPAGRPAGRPASATARPTAPVAPPAPRLTVTEERMLAAARRVCAGWPLPATPMLRPAPDASELQIVWGSGGAQARVVMLRALPDGSGELLGAVVSQATGAPAAHREPLARWDTLPDENALALAIRLGMERVASWPDPTSLRI
jgi:hypothetical protein